jgi:ClpP class serine protease
VAVLLLEEILMTPGDVLWMFFALSALQPVLKQRFLEASRQRLIARIKRQRNSRVILLLHRRKNMSFLGFSVYWYIDANDLEGVLRAIHLTDWHVPAGHRSAYARRVGLGRAANRPRHSQASGKVTAFVPHYAMSGDTLIALAADEIVMNEDVSDGSDRSATGPVPAASILKAVARKPVAEVDDETLILPDQAEKATAVERERAGVADRQESEREGRRARSPALRGHLDA